MAKKGGRSAKTTGSGPGWRDSMGPAAIIIGVILVFGGLVVANELGVFTPAGGLPCAGVEGGQVVHEHAKIFVYLDSETPYDFSGREYQVQDGRLHFEYGARDARGAVAHIHQERPSLRCLFSTLNWDVGPDGIETDKGEFYPIDDAHTLSITLNGEELKEGFNADLQGCGAESGTCFTYVIRYETVPGASDGGAMDGSDTGNGGNQTGNATASDV